MECKWTSKPVGIDILAELERKSKLIRPELENRRIRFTLCARSGFTPQLMRDIEQQSDVMLLDLPDIVG